MSNVIELVHKKIELPSGEIVTKVSFKISTPDGVIQPSDLKSVDLTEFPDIEDQGVIIEGRGPIWLYGFLQGELQDSAGWVGTFDPRLDGAVVVYPAHSAGEVIKLS